MKLTKEQKVRIIERAHNIVGSNSPTEQDIYILGASWAAQEFGGIQWQAYPENKPVAGVKVLTFRPQAKETGDKEVVVQCYDGRIQLSPQGVEHGWDRWCHVTHFAEINLPT